MISKAMSLLIFSKKLPFHHKTQVASLHFFILIKTKTNLVPNLQSACYKIFVYFADHSDKCSIKKSRKTRVLAGKERVFE